MGRLFKIDLEDPIYKCKHCETGFIDEDLQIKRESFFEYRASLGKLYFFTKCFNVVIETYKVTITSNGVIDDTMRPVFCIGCGSHLGLYYGGIKDTGMYSEGNFYINRFKLKGKGPPEGSEDENPENQEV